MLSGDTLIGIFKLAKASILLVVSLGAITLLDTKIRADATMFVTHLSGDSHFRLLRTASRFIGLASERGIEMLSIGSFFYAALFATEGVGLLLHKRWAEYFTSIVTASFLPLEIYEIVRKPDLFKIVIFSINIAVLIYLVWHLYNKK
jgi:uncharacterized membrane protein (DUF2068 family)